jgi:hypothetical protein
MRVLHQGPDPGRSIRLVSGLTAAYCDRFSISLHYSTSQANGVAEVEGSGPCESTSRVRQLPKDLTQGYGSPETEERLHAWGPFNHVSFPGTYRCRSLSLQVQSTEPQGPPGTGRAAFAYFCSTGDRSSRTLAVTQNPVLPRYFGL